MNIKGRKITASFQGTVAANSNLTLVAHKIDLPFSIKRVRAAFAPGANRLLRLSYYISPDPSAPTTKPPSGANIFQEMGPNFYIVGDDNIVDFDHEILTKEAGYHLKVYAENLDAFEHTIDTQITVEVYPRKDFEEALKEEK